VSPEKTGTGGGNDGDDNVVQFPKTAEERRALRKAKEALEKQRLINVFIDEAGGDKALFHTSDGVAYADLMINGHRETWPVRSKQFRHTYLRYLQRQFDQLAAEEDQPLLAMSVKASMSKASVNHAIDDFERRAIAIMRCCARRACQLSETDREPESGRLGTGAGRTTQHVMEHQFRPIRYRDQCAG